MKRILGIAMSAALLLPGLSTAQSADDIAAIQARQLSVSGDYAGALALLGPLVERGHPRAQAVLGVMTEGGEGMPADPVAALELFRASAAQGFPGGLYAVGAAYHNGSNGVTQDYAQARKWYWKAASLDFGPALTDLGRLLRDGQGGPKDPVTALALMERATTIGDRNGIAELAYMLATGDGAVIDLPRARKLYAIAAAHGIDWAERDYGEMLELGEGGPVDLNLALDYYRRAAAQGYGMSAFDIFEMYRANSAALPEIKAEALAMCLYAEAQPPQWDGSEYDGKCDPAFPDYTAEEIAAAREKAAAM
jgi:TPR repeat protein